MSLEIVNILNNGIAKKECILLKATKSINVHSYAIIDKTFEKDHDFSNIYRRFYQFPSKSVKEGDYVSLRSGRGAYRPDTICDGSTVHIFYWGSSDPIWDDGNIRSAEVLRVEIVNRKTIGHAGKRKFLY